MFISICGYLTYSGIWGHVILCFYNIVYFFLDAIPNAVTTETFFSNLVAIQIAASAPFITAKSYSFRDLNPAPTFKV